LLDNICCTTTVSFAKDVTLFSSRKVTNDIDQTTTFCLNQSMTLRAGLRPLQLYYYYYYYYYTLYYYVSYVYTCIYEVSSFYGTQRGFFTAFKSAYHQTLS
jgi:hypothetical protein